MKTNKIKIFFSIISFCFLVTSCNNLLSELTQQKTYIQISTNLGNTNQRTVLPDFSVVQGQGYTWELYCDSKVLQTWNDDDEKSAYNNMCESKIEVDPGSYAFELKVLKDNFIILKSESQTVTIEQNKNNELNFVLCPPTENEAKGSVNFILNFPNDKVNIVVANLFRPDDDKNVPVGNMPEVVISQTTANITVNNVPAGSYLLKVDLCYQVADYSRIETINTYTTIVQVAAGFCSKAEVTLEELTDYYTITYMVDDEIITTFQESNVIPTTYKKNSNVRLPIAYNDEQLSTGWFNDKDCTDPVELNIDDKFTITKNTTLYTQWGNVVNEEDLSFDTIDTENNIEGLLIKNETGLNYFRNIVNGTLTENIIVSDDFVYRKGTPYPTVNAKLCSDINLPADSEWEPIGYYKTDEDNKAYNGIFDGNGKCVTNLKNSNPTSSIGFFGYIETAIIKNLYVSGEIYCNSNYIIYIGGIVGYAKSSGINYSSISNCVNNVSIKNENSTIGVGGILGWSSGAVDINSCVNIADITNCYSVAGILGYGDYNVTINNCLNLGSITMNGAYNAVAGIANIFGDTEISSVTLCINASSIQGKDEDDNIYPIAYIANSDYATLSKNYYDSTILPTVTVTPVDDVFGKNSSELDNLDLEDWYNDESDSKYPIPRTIKETFEENTSCWGIIFEAAKIPEATSGYVEDAYFVNGEDGDDDNNNGLSIDDPYQKLTTAITQAIESGSRTVYVSGTLTPSNQGITDPSSGEHEQYSVFYIQDNAFDDVVEIIGVSENTNFSGNNETRIFSTKNACNFKMKNINFINGNTIGSGAAIYFWQGSLELDSCKISGNSSTLGNAYNGIYNYGGSVLKMTNTTCENSVYLSNTTATIGSNCTIGTASPDATDGFITLDDSTLKLDGENIFIYKPIYVKSLSSSIQIGDDYSHREQITIKLASGITDTYSDSNPYTLITNCDATKSNYFTIECEDSTKTATLGANGKITVMN